jgi:PAS domain S-box-containing protein
VQADEGGEAPCFAHLLSESEAASEALLAQLVTTMADAVVITDEAGTVTYWNDASARLFGWSPDEAIGRSLDLIIPERLRDRHWAGYRRVMATGHIEDPARLLQVPALHRDGRRLSIAFRVTLLPSTDQLRRPAIAAVIRDDTERWEEQRRLEAEVARLTSGRPALGRS